MERNYVLFTDDEDEAFAELQKRRALAGDLGTGEPRYRGWDMARVLEMDDPPPTNSAFCVFQIEGNK